ncbi:MAG: phage portal protein [Clostridia bacterium]|nr:phage portal protein [Clostridia bacterium]
MFNFQFNGWLTPFINDIIRKGSESRIADLDFIRKEINRFLDGPQRADMIKGNNYYKGIHDILGHKRTVIGEGGEVTEVENLPNDRLVNNQYGKLVDQKVNYLLGKQITFNTDNKVYSKILNDEVFNASFDRLMLEVGEDSLNCGIGWIYVYYNEFGELSFRRFKPWQIIPGWADDEHTKLDYAIRVYPVLLYEGRNNEKLIHKIEVYDNKGITKFVKDGSTIYADGSDWQIPYFYADNMPLGWDRIPLIPFKANRNELPLLKRVKSLQDALNLMMSNFDNNMQEDVRNTILILKNYDGENLGEFRRNLATYGAVKVKTVNNSDGDVTALTIAVNSENYKSIIELLKKSIIENAMGFDAKDDRLSGNPNQMNIQSMYSDVDLDANKMEMEYKASFERLLWFVNAYLSQTGKGNFDNEEVDIIFNRDILINESEAIDNCAKSQGILSDETIVAQHPWIDDVQDELKKLKKQKEENMAEYGLPMGQAPDTKGDKSAPTKGDKTPEGDE